MQFIHNLQPGEVPAATGTWLLQPSVPRSTSEVQPRSGHAAAAGGNPSIRNNNLGGQGKDVLAKELRNRGLPHAAAPSV